jgi:hypothetical protein
LVNHQKSHTKTIKFSGKKLLMGTGEYLNLQEIEDAFSRLKICPKCNSQEGFWLGLKTGHTYAQCKDCGTKLELFEIFPIDERTKASRWLKFFRK